MTSFRKSLLAATGAVALTAGFLGADDVRAADAYPADQAAALASIVRAPTDLPAAVDRDAPATLQVTLETIEREARLDDGTVFRYWTFDGQVPGPMIRARVGDTIEVTLKNPDDSWMPHSVDFHAVTGPGGGAVATQTLPGEATGFSFQALNPGVYVYHCATPMVADHIQAGMYGLIVVEPEEGLPEVDREFYVMQGEIYAEDPIGTAGLVATDYEALADERPEFYVFNGAVEALTGEHALTAEVGETVRIFFGVGGPNKTSSFHVIGEIFDAVAPFGSVTADPSTDVQTVSVAPGGATMVDFRVEVPGTYVLVDHALSRVEKGLAGHLVVEGLPDTAIYDDGTRTAASAE